MRRQPRHIASAILVSAVTATLMTPIAFATDGVWIGGGGDSNWSNINNWAVTTVADGQDGTASFALDLNGDQTVTVDSNRTIGNLTFSDADPINTTGNWLVNGSGPLTLSRSTGTPTITVNSLGAANSAQFSVPIAGTQGVQVAGSGTVISTAANTFTGGLTIPAGSTFSGGANYIMGTTTATAATGNAVTVNGSFLLRSAAAANAVIFSLSGSGTIGADAVATAGMGLRIKQGTFSGNISDGPGGANGAHLAVVFDSTAPGTIDLSGVNTYTGDTLVRTSGVLRLSSTTALPDLSFLRFEANGTLELNAGGDFSRKLGGTSNTGSGGVTFNTGIDGFGTIGQDRKVTLTDGINPIPLKWATGGFNPGTLILSTANSTHKTTFTNDIDLNGAARTLSANNGLAAIDGEFAGVISNSSATAASLTLNGQGTMVLTADNSSFTGAITIASAIVRVPTMNSLGAPTTALTFAGGASGTGRLELTDGQVLAKTITLQGRQLGSSLSPAISGVSGNTTVTGNITASSGGNLYNLAAEAGTLTVTGTMTLGAGITGDRFYQFMGAAGQGFATGNITNGPGTLNVDKFGNGSWTFSGPANTYTGYTKVHAGTLTLASSLPTASATSVLGVDDGAILAVSPGGDKTVKGASLAITGSGKLDLADNRLVLTAYTPDSLRGLLLTGRTGTTAGDWKGVGVQSSVAAAPAAGGLTAIGYALASDLGVSSWGAVATLNPTDLVARYTYYGDLNLDGKVNADDYALLDRGFAKQLPGWLNGDVNYDNVVDGNDYALVDKTFALQGAPLSADFLAAREAQFGPEYVQSLLASVPEPAALGACMLVAVLPKRRRR